MRPGRPQANWGRCGDKDVAARYDPSRSARTLFEVFGDLEKTNPDLPAVTRWRDLPDEQKLAVSNYFEEDQRWDATPIHKTVYHLSKRSVYGAPPMPFAPSAFRRIKKMTDTQFRAWLALARQAQATLPELIPCLGFSASIPNPQPTPTPTPPPKPKKGRPRKSMIDPAKYHKHPSLRTMLRQLREGR